jgi:hypothetical protein
MRLKAGSSVAFELIILRYQFPDVHEDRWDSNWLVVLGKVATNDGNSWHFTDPAVTTFELADLADWLRDVAVRENTYNDFEFTEPKLGFFLKTDPQPTLRVKFAHESAPPWVSEHERVAGVFVDFPLSEADVAVAADELREALNDFPIRGGAA